METWICVNCGVEYPAAAQAPMECRICQDERVVTPLEQVWIASREVAALHKTALVPHEPGLMGLVLAPEFAIGQQAILVEQNDGCILWDCLSLVDDTAVQYIESRGGLKAIAMSHPHFYGAMSTWSVAFGDVPVYIHEGDREWVVNPTRSTKFWSGETHTLDEGVTIVHCGGHFEGSCVMHVPNACAGSGALLSGDTLMVLPNALGVSFMRSYPLYVPLPLGDIERIERRLQPYRFERIYGPWSDRCITDGNAELTRAVNHYKAALAA